MMGRALAPHPAAAPAPSPARKQQHQHPSSLRAVSVLGRVGPRLTQQQHTIIALQRRTFIYGLVGAGLGSAVRGGDANAASRRPPPPPPTEKKDPNVSGVQAKVLASKKRKEAMKEAMAQERERGKPIDKPISEPVGEPPQ